MTITTQATKVIVSGNGAQTVFNYNFLIDQPGDCALIYTDANGNSTPQSSSNFTVTGVGNPAGGTFTFSLGGTPIAAGTSLTFYRSVVYEQEYDPNNQATYYLQALENALDQLELQIQQLAEIASRTFAAPITDKAPQMTFPSAAQRANLYAAFDQYGNATAVASLTAGATVSAAMQVIINEATTANAVAALGAPLVLINIAALRAYAGEPPLSILLQGYYAIDDAGGGIFYPTLDTTSADNGGTIIVDAASRRWYRDTSNGVTVKQFGAKGDGLSDDTVAIQAAYTYGGVVEFPNPGGNTQYLVSSAIVVGSDMLTLGNGAQITTNSATADVFHLGPTGYTSVTRIVFKDLSVWSSVVKTAGAAFKGMCAVYNSAFYNVQAGSLDNYDAYGNRLWNAWDLTNSFSRVLFDKACFAIAQNYGVYCSGTSSVAAAEIQLDLRTLFCYVGIYIAGSAGGMYVNGEISVCQTGVLSDTSVSGSNNRELFLEPGAIIDSCQNYGLHITANSVSIVDITGSWISSSGQVVTGQGVAILIDPFTTSSCNVRMTGARIYNNKGPALQNDGAVMLASACMFDSNQGTSVILLQSAQANGSSVQACNFNANNGTAITINSVSEYSIDGNNFSGNGGGVSGGAWTTSQAIRNNVGYQTRNSGLVVIASGTNSSGAINHGLVGTPAFFSLASNDNTSTALKYYITAVSSTQFTIGTTANVAAAISVYWEASMGPNS